MKMKRMLLVGLVLLLATKSLYALESNNTVISSAAVWDMSENRQKVGIVKGAIELLKLQGVEISKEAEFYVEEIDGIRQESLEMKLKKVGVMLNAIAIMYRDYDNGEDPDKLIQYILGGEEGWNDYVNNNDKEEYERIYKEWKASREPNEKMLEIESALLSKGYDPGSVDGFLDDDTREAIAGFQKDSHLEVTRFMDQATFDKLIRGEIKR